MQGLLICIFWCFINGFCWEKGSLLGIGHVTLWIMGHWKLPIDNLTIAWVQLQHCFAENDTIALIMYFSIYYVSAAHKFDGPTPAAQLD